MWFINFLSSVCPVNLHLKLITDNSNGKREREREGVGGMQYV